MNRIYIALFILLTTSCAKQSLELSGEWSRQAEEPAMFLSGIENINIKPDSTFMVTNNMLFSHTDSALSCNAKFVINVSGQWELTKQNTLIFRYQPESLTISSDSASFSLKATKKDVEIPSEITAQTYSELVKTIEAYYTQGYTAITANGGMMMMSPQIIDSRLYAQIGGETVCWEKIVK